MKKNNSRRQFLKKGALASFAIPLMGSGLLSNQLITQTDGITLKPQRSLKVLILGGTSFLGPHQIKYALSRGHSVTTFTRGKTTPKIHPEIFKDVEQLIGDRENNLKALENRNWDVVIDNSGRQVKWTKDTAELLKEKVSLYIYTSSTGVYYPYVSDYIDEQTNLVLKMPEGLTEGQKYEQDYGIMKANSELAALNTFGKERTIVIRPTYMVGPGDRTDRFIHWPLRLSKGGEVLVPGKKADLVQYIDIRDVAEWYIKLAENQTAGIFNAVGPRSEQTIHQFVKDASKSFEVKTTMIPIEDYDFLKSQELYYSIPWVMADAEHFGSARISNKNSLKAGLSYRHLEETIRDTYNWWNSNAVSDERRQKYLEMENSFHNREKNILQTWKSRKH